MAKCSETFSSCNDFTSRVITLRFNLQHNNDDDDDDDTENERPQHGKWTREDNKPARYRYFRSNPTERE